MDLGWLAQLGATGAAALVQAAATEVWQLARSRFIRLFGRGDKEREAAAQRRLDALAAEVEQTPPAQRDQVRQRLLPVWQARLADLIEEDPAAAEALRSLLDELLALLPRPQYQWVQNVTATASGAGASANAQGVMFANVMNHPAQANVLPAYLPVLPAYPPHRLAQPGTNVMAILSLVFAFVFAPVGIVLGHLAKKQISQTGEQGRQVATWGLILSYVFAGLSLLACCAWLGAVM